MTKTVREEARSRGIRLTFIKNGKRSRKSIDVLRKEIRAHDDKIVREKANQAKNMISLCKTIIVNSSGTKVYSQGPPPPPPPPPPPMGKKKANSSSPPKSFFYMNELKGKINKMGLKQKANKGGKNSSSPKKNKPGPSSPPVSKILYMNELKGKMSKMGLKKKSNQNA